MYNIFQKIARPEVIKIILEEHKQLEKDLMAMSILKDPLLLANLQNPETVRRVAEQHRVLLEASETIVKTLKQAKSLTDPEVSIPAAIATVDENLSDSSSSGSDSNSPESSAAQGILQRITSEQVASALFQAQGQGSNSLANISQRNFSITNDQRISASMLNSAMSEAVRAVRETRPIITPNFETQQASSEVVPFGDNVTLQSRESNVDEEQSPSGSTINNQRSSSSMLMATMSEVVRAARLSRQQASSEVAPFINNEHNTVQSEEDVGMLSGYREQLQQMQEMGLTNTNANIQALVICAGDVGTAINLVLSDLNNFS
ncbi:unnamed protein product [Diamesa hyperborea]